MSAPRRVAKLLTPRAIHWSIAMMVLGIVSPVAVGYYFTWHPMDNDRGFGVLIVAVGVAFLLGLFAVILAAVGGRWRPRSTTTRVTLGFAALWAMAMIALAVTVVLSLI